MPNSTCVYAKLHILDMQQKYNYKYYVHTQQSTCIENTVIAPSVHVVAYHFPVPVNYILLFLKNDNVGEKTYSGFINMHTLLNCTCSSNNKDLITVNAKSLQFFAKIVPINKQLAYSYRYNANVRSSIFSV